MRGIAFTNLVVVPCRVSLLPVARFEIHYETPPVGTRALVCAENRKPKSTRAASAGFHGLKQRFFSEKVMR